MFFLDFAGTDVGVNNIYIIIYVCICILVGTLACMDVDVYG